VSIYGGGAIITENLIEDGQDMGITVHGLHNVVANNRIIRQGAGGIWSSGADSVFANNVIEGWPGENNVNPSTLGAIILYSANRCLVIGNILDGLDLPFAKYGIIVTGIADGNTLALNKVKGVSTFGIHLYNATVTNTKLRDNEASVGHGKGAVGGDYGTLVGTGSPEGVVTAGVGTLYRRKDGGASTSLYIKESGTGNTGWRAI
jgi:hypothetical protein